MPLVALKPLSKERDRHPIVEENGAAYSRLESGADDVRQTFAALIAELAVDPLLLLNLQR